MKLTSQRVWTLLSIGFTIFNPYSAYMSPELFKMQTDTRGEFGAWN